MHKDKVAYWLLELKLLSAMSIGAADSTLTDHDVMLDSRNLPMIPGTSIAGVLRSFFSSSKANQYFGESLDDGEGEGKSQLSESVVRVYDATWIDGNKAISARDNVALKDKVAESGLKFDRLTVERGAVFEAHVEITNTDVCSVEELETALCGLANGTLALGGKTSRGLGRVKVAGCWRREFDLSKDEQLNDWLGFNQFGEHDLRSEKYKVDISGKATYDDAIVISLGLKQNGALSVREYSTELDRPDFTQLHIRDTTLVDNKDGSQDIAVIPGTSWAGAFRSRYFAAAPVRASDDGFDATEMLFGAVKRFKVSSKAANSAMPNDEHDIWETRTRRSRIEFSESEIKGGNWKSITRNSIDCFTGGTKDGALFTLRTHYAGETKLTIRIRCSNETWDKNAIAPLIIAIADLHNGFMPVGGLTAVGHGLFKITSAECVVCGKPYDEFAGDLLNTHSEFDEEFIVPKVNEISQRIVSLLGEQGEGSVQR